MARIATVRAQALSLPLHTPFVTALRRTQTLDTLVVRVETSDGAVGLGEAPQVWAVTGESVLGAAACVEQVLAPVLSGADTDDWATLAAALQRACARNEGAKAAAETALLDAAARTRGVALAELLAAEFAGPAAPRASGTLVVPTDVTVSAGTPEQLADAARARVAEGFDRLKLKVGTDADQDVARVRAVRQAVGPAVGVRLDANQGWSREQAVTVICALERADLDIEVVEQPVAAADLEGLAWVRERVRLPILADESVWNESELARCIRLGAADAVNVKLAKCAGPLAAVRMLRQAREAGLGTMVGSMMESSLGVAAAAAVVLAAGGTTLVPDLDAAWWIASSPYAGELSYAGGLLRLPAGPGLGLTLAEPGTADG